MSDSGLIRRLDNLGRIVIPKEIRKNLSIKEGEPLQITLNKDGEIVLNKTSVFKNIVSYLQIVCETINEILDIPTMITDKESIICVSGIGKNKFLNKELSRQIKNQIESRKSYISKLELKTEMIKILSDDENNYFWQLIVPIVVENVTAGSLIILSLNQNIKFPDCSIKVLEISSKIISKMLE